MILDEALGLEKLLMVGRCVHVLVSKAGVGAEGRYRFRPTGVTEHLGGTYPGLTQPHEGGVPGVQS